MKKLYIFVLLFCLLIVTLYFALSSYNIRNYEAKEVYSSKSVSKNSSIDEIDYKDEKMEIHVYYPVTIFSELNKTLLTRLEDEVSSFKSKVENINTEERKLTLNINFDSYEYKEYISYAFYITEDCLGAHPNYRIFTINFDTKNNKFITINSLAEQDSDILNKLSEYSYEDLSKNEKIVEYGNLDMLREGTCAKLENFQNFVFTKLGLLIFFEKYSVAPYVLGEFSVNIPYENLK